MSIVVWLFLMTSFCSIFSISGKVLERMSPEWVAEECRQIAHLDTKEKYDYSFPVAECRSYLTPELLPSVYGSEKPEEIMQWALTALSVSNYDRSEKHLEELVNLNYTRAFFYLAWLYQKKDQLDAAKFLYRKAIERAQSGYAYNNLGTLYAIEGDYEKAKSYWKEASKMGIREASRNLQLLELTMRDILANKIVTVVLQFLPIVPIIIVGFAAYLSNKRVLPRSQRLLNAFILFSALYTLRSFMTSESHTE